MAHDTLIGMEIIGDTYDVGNNMTDRMVIQW